MPDIAMCSGDGCPKKIGCYRHRAVPTPQRQAYFATSPIAANGECAHFLELRKNDMLNDAKVEGRHE